MFLFRKICTIMAPETRKGGRCLIKAFRFILVVVAGVLLGILSFSSYKLMQDSKVHSEARAKDSSVSQSYEVDRLESVPSPRVYEEHVQNQISQGWIKLDDEISPLNSKYDLSQFFRDYPDAIGWIYCPDTPIDYGVVEHEDNDYYLHRFYDGSYSVGGSLFADCVNARDFSDDNTVIYGHHMNDGTKFARVSYYIRSPKRDILQTLTEWIDSAAVGAAKGTQTRVEKEIVAGTYERLHNKTLSKVIQKNLEAVGGVIYDARERAFAEALIKASGNPDSLIDHAARVEPLAEFAKEGSGGSSDVGDVSWVVPLASFGAATFVPGSPGHSWQNVAADGSTIGTKGLLVASKVFALTAVDLFTDAKLLRDINDEFLKATGPEFKYAPLLGDRKPALDYRVIKKD